MRLLNYLRPNPKLVRKSSRKEVEFCTAEPPSNTRMPGLLALKSAMRVASSYVAPPTINTTTSGGREPVFAHQCQVCKFCAQRMAPTQQRRATSVYHSTFPIQ